MKSSHKEIFLVVIFALVYVLAVLWPVSIKGLTPFPGNLLLGRMFPWDSMTWEGYPNGVAYKEFVAADAVRQTYPWRFLAIEQLKQGQLPWWNPYAFAGSPLLANMQSAPFYPLNFVYWLIDFPAAWVLQVLLQPMMALVFSYLLGRSLNLTKQASLIIGLSFAFSGYLMIWMELNTVGHAAVWLPLILWGINKLHKSFKWYGVIYIGLVASIFANHLQTSLFIYLVALIYWAVKLQQHRLLDIKKRFKHFLAIGFTLIAGLATSAIQLYPGWELLQESARSGQDPQIFAQFLLPWSHLVTAIIPNYFGNPATNNYFGQDYGEFMVYAGLISLVLGLIGVERTWVTKGLKNQRFFIFLAGVSLLLSLNTPIAWIPQWLGLPILESSAPARWLFLFQFALAVLAGIGYDQARQKTTHLLKSSVVVLTLIIGVVVVTGIRYLIATDLVVRTELLISLKQSIPSLGIIFGLLAVSYVIIVKIKKYRSRFLFVGLAGLALVDSSWFATRYLPFSDWDHFYPATPPFEYIKAQDDLYRFYGDYTASVMSNIWLTDGLYGVEGYDSLYLKRYGQLLAAAANSGEIPTKINRSDANLKSNQDDFYRQRLQDVLGVKYILDKNEFGNPQELNPRFPADRYSLVWHENPFYIYQNLAALPRFYLVNQYQAFETDQALLDEFFNPEWDPRTKVLLESAQLAQFGSPLTTNERENISDLSNLEVYEYQPNYVEVNISSPTDAILVVSDAYYPDWTAYLNGQQVEIYRANYAFRAVAVPEGEHKLEFKYIKFSLE